MRPLLLSILAVGACGGPDVSQQPDADLPTDAAIADAESPDAMLFDNGVTTFTATKQGSPLWETAGWSTFSSTQMFATVQQVFGKHEFHAGVNAFGPDVVHAAPYDTEVADALTALGLDPGNRFIVSDWTIPRTLSFVAVIVPSEGAPTGETSDEASGPMIPDANQLYVDADMLRGSTVVDPDFDGPYPKLSTIDPSLDVDGWSHMTLAFGEDTSFIPGVPGSYKLRVHVYEIATPANGWVIEVPFTVE